MCLEVSRGTGLVESTQMGNETTMGAESSIAEDVERKQLIWYGNV